LSTTLGKLSAIANTVNGSLLLQLYNYMKSNGSSDSHMNNVLKTNQEKEDQAIKPLFSKSNFR
jgi:hypothetical protein